MGSNHLYTASAGQVIGGWVAQTKTVAEYTNFKICYYSMRETDHAGAVRQASALGANPREPEHVWVDGVIFGLPATVPAAHGSLRVARFGAGKPAEGAGVAVCLGLQRAARAAA
jgi:hypothetical protein